MIKVKLIGHDYRYEVFHILSLFFTKEEISFVNEDEDISSILNKENNYIETIFKFQGKLYKDKTQLNAEDKKEVKNSLKMTMLKCLEEFHKMKIPWGILIGIRPTKIAHDFKRAGFSEKEIEEKLISSYSLTKEKAALTVEVAKNERPFLKTKSEDISLYIGIPFCPTRCSYCSFTSNPIDKNKALTESYLKALNKEIDTIIPYIKDRGLKLDTIYIGGGTPTALSAFQLEQLLERLNDNVDLSSIREFTVEAGRPDSITLDKLEVLKKYHCSRTSINPQSMNNSTLELIGRLHTAEEIVEKFKLAREYGFDNINMDIIIGLPNETKKDVEYTLNVINALKPESITVHTMAVKRASRLYEKHFKSFEDVKGISDMAYDFLRQMEMKPYYMYRQKNMVTPLENIGFCLSGKECVYNIQMIAENITVIGLGADAVTKVIFSTENRIERYSNIKDIKEYVNRIDEQLEAKKEIIDEYVSYQRK